LMDLRKRADETLNERRAELQMQLERMAVVDGARAVRGKGSALKGRKVPPKYRSPSGETWAGRGARPRWLVAAIDTPRAGGGARASERAAAAAFMCGRQLCLRQARHNHRHSTRRMSGRRARA